MIRQIKTIFAERNAKKGTPPINYKIKNRRQLSNLTNFLSKIRECLESKLNTPKETNFVRKQDFNALE